MSRLLGPRFRYPFGLFDLMMSTGDLFVPLRSRYGIQPVTVDETDTHYEMKIPMAGVGKDNIEVVLTEGSLVVNASDSHEDDESERSMKYHGQWTLPNGHGEVTSKYENGLLEILIEKPEEEIPEVTEIPVD